MEKNVGAQDRNGNLIARKAGTGLVKAEEIDTVIGEYQKNGSSSADGA